MPNHRKKHVKIQPITESKERYVLTAEEIAELKFLLKEAVRFFGVVKIALSRWTAKKGLLLNLQGLI